MISPGGNKKARQSLFFRLCAAGSFHSVVSTNTSLYIAGRNIGQFGSEIQIFASESVTFEKFKK